MKIEFCEEKDIVKINDYNEYNNCIVVYADNVTVKETIDYRYYRNRDLEALALSKTKKSYYFFKKEPKKRFYYYDLNTRKQITLKLKFNYLFVGFNNNLDIVKRFKYDSKKDWYYCKKL